MTIILTSAGGSIVNAQTKIQNINSVTNYGAIGDGINDDTAAIKTALISTNTVYFPNGVYIISDTLLIESGKRLIGESWCAILFLKNGANRKIIRNSDIANGNENIWIETLAIDGNSINQTGGSSVSGIEFEKVTGFKLHNVYVHHVRENPILIKEASDFEITGCRTEYAQGATYPGMYIGYSGTGAVNGVISNCYSNYNGQDGILVENAFNVRVIGCSAKYNGQSGIKVGSPTNCIVSSCYAEGNTSGFRGQGIKRCSYTGNISYRNNDSGITLGLPNANTRDILIANNQCIENGQSPTSTSYGIMVNQGSTGSVTGLYIKDNICIDNQEIKTQTRGISLDSSGAEYSELYVEGNYCKGNSISDYYNNTGAVIKIGAGNIGYTGSSSVEFIDMRSVSQLSLFVDNIIANTATTYLLDGSSGRGYVMPRDGYFKGIMAKVSASITSGSMSFLVKVNGISNSLNVTLDENTLQYKYVFDIPETRLFNKGDMINCAYVSSVDLSASATINANVIIEVVC